MHQLRAAAAAVPALVACLGGLALGSGCAAPPAARPAAAPSRVAAKPAKPELNRPLPPLTPREQALAKALRGDVAHLAGKIGERNAKQKWELADAADYLANTLEDMGYHVERQGYEVGEILAMNLSVDVPGGERGDELVVIGAHYDSAEGSPGADDNASGAAAVLALARQYKDKHLSRSLRFVEFVNAEPPYYQTDNMGSVRYAKALAARNERVAAMLSIDNIGYYSDAPGSQHYPAAIAPRYPRLGNFIAFTGRSGRDLLLGRVVAAFREHASIPAEAVELPAGMKDAGSSDNWAFWQFDFPGVMVSDTAAFRYPHYRTAKDTPDKLDYGRMARVVAGLEDVIDKLALRQHLAR